MIGPDRPPRRRDQDDDPTGVQHLLSSLPGPGPMPDDLVQRINDSLREESERRGDRAEAPYALFAGRVARRRTPWVAVAAVAASLVVLGGGLLTGFGNSMPAQLSILTGATPGGGQRDITRGPTSAGSSTVARASEDDVPLTGPSTGSPGADLNGGDRGPGVTRGAQVIAMSGRAYSAPMLRAQAATLLRGPLATLPPLAAESPAVGPIGTAVGLRSCLLALGMPADAQATVDIATYDDEPVAVIVTLAGDTAQVHVVGRACSEGDPALIAGPYAL